MRIAEEARPRLRTMMIGVAAELISRFRVLEEAGAKGIDRYSYPRFVEEGVYRRVKRSSDGPKKYYSTLGRMGDYGVQIGYDELSGFNELCGFVADIPDMVEFLAPSRLREILRKDLLQFEMAIIAGRLADRHIHLAGWDIDNGVMESQYRLIESWMLEEHLPIELVIPILGVSFESDRVNLSEGRYVLRLSDEEQLARWPGRPNTADDEVLRMATHALHLPNYGVGNVDALSWMTYPDPQGEISAAVDFFRSLCTVTAAPSGYAQVIPKPLGWAHDFTASLPVFMESAIESQYSPHLDTDRAEPSETLDQSQIEELVRAERSIAKGLSKTLDLASSRALKSQRRESEVDRVVDLCIALEALAGGDGGDLTYKLAVRSSAVLASRGIEAPFEFFDAVRGLYKYRSASVHGNLSSEKLRMITLRGRKWPASSVGEFVVTELLAAVRDDPLLTPAEMDRRFVGAAITGLGFGDSA